LINKALIGIFYFILAIFAFQNRDYISNPDALLEMINSYGAWTPIIFYALYLASALFFFPASFVTLISGLLFGLKLGFIHAMAGTLLASGFSFMIARYFARDWVIKHSNEVLAKVEEGVNKDGWRYLAFMRLVPVFPFSILNYIFGLTPMKTWVFLLTSLISSAPLTFSYAYLGYAGREAVAGNSESIIKLALGLALLILISFLPRFFKRK
jgi:uncharacterized membrane protein YdjX (TVP38/TMEM64 family)